MGKIKEANGSPASYVCVAVCGMSLSICRGKYRPETRDYQCVMPSVAPLQFSSKVKIGGRSLESTLPASPYTLPGRLARQGGRWVDREDEPGWVGHDFQPRRDHLRRLTPASSMCTPCHELTGPLIYHPLTGAKPVYPSPPRRTRRPVSAPPAHINQVYAALAMCNHAE